VSSTARPDVQDAAGDTASARPVLSAVVFAYRNEDTVVRAVASLVDQDFDEPYEVIVATSGGDRTADVVRQAHPQVRVVESSVRLMPGGARNLGMEVARGEIVAFLEGDCVARPGWIRNRVAAHRAGHGAVASAVAVANPQRLAARVTAYLCYDNRLEGASEGPAGIPRSYGLSFTRELLDRAGPFDEALRVNEDSLMARRLDAMGVEVWFDPSVCIEHTGPERLREVWRDQAARGRRQARTELVSVPPGSWRTKLESRSVVLALALRTARHAAVRGRFLAKNLQSCAPDRRDLLASVPWIVAGFLVNTWGWAREESAYARTGSFTERDGAGPTHAPLRRQTATTGEKTLVLTFDDGPSAFTTGVLRVLREYGVPATFFVLGERVAASPEIARQVADEGHQLAIHGWSHTAFTELDVEDLESEVDRTRGLLRELTGVECDDVRPPYGRYDGAVVSWLAERGYVTWLWTADGRDYEAGAGVDRIVSNTLTSLTPGGIVLLHDGGGDRSKTVRALPGIIEGARDRGFRFVALSTVKASLRPVTS